MDQLSAAAIKLLTIEFNENDIECLFAQVYDFYFAPRNPKYRTLAAVEIAKAVQLYETEKQLAPWLEQALACKQRSAAAVDDEQNLAPAIDKILDTNKSFVAALVDCQTTWARGITILWTLVFVEVYGEFPKNKPGTALYYADGATDDRWEQLLHKKNAAEDKTGYRYMIEALERRGAKP